MLRQYATFCLLPRLRAAAPGTLTTGSARYAARAFTCGQAFCDWLQAAGIRPASLTQAGLDRWHAAASRTTAKMTSGFLGFAMTEGSLPRLKLPAHPAPGPATQPISDQQRLALIRRALTDSTGPVRTRAAGLLVLLFAQPASRITRLTLDDITAGGTGTTFLRLGDPPVCVPEPFAALLRQAAAAAADHPAAAISAAGRWLFPGQNAGRPLHPATLSHLLTEYVRADLGVLSAAGCCAHRRAPREYRRWSPPASPSRSDGCPWSRTQSASGARRERGSCRQQRPQSRYGPSRW